MRKIFLYGPPGSGKSTAGRLLADRLGLTFADLDTLIEANAGTSIPEIMNGQGEPAFREIEAQALKTVCSDGSGVVALGGGALLREASRAAAESCGAVVCLEAGLATLAERLRADENQRPLLTGDLEAKLSGLLEKRSGHYRSIPLRFSTDVLALEQVVWQIQVALGRFRIRGMGSGYDVLVEPGGLDSLGECLRQRSLGGPVALVTDERVGPLYAARAEKSLRSAGFATTVITIPEGEASKTIRTVMELWRGFLQAGLDRRSTAVALGGGVTGDLSGFAAATFLRGIPWAVVPTSLLAMADASLGGKTGFDLPEGKNLVGSFHPPALVLADAQVLDTLPEAELRSGLAEVVKHGVVGDPALFEMCAAGIEAVKNDLPGLVRRAMAVKIAVIEADPYEGGQRAALNLGHTVGHAVETASGYRLRHGEAVSVGMVAEARLAERLGLASAGLSEAIEAALAALGLPTGIPSDLSPEAIIRGMKVDKKKTGGTVRFALPVRIGEVRTGVAVEDLELIFEE